MNRQLVASGESSQSPFIAQPELADIQRQLAASSYAALRATRCWLNGPTIMIDGRVPSFPMKQLAQVLVRKLSAGRSIENRLEVA